MLEKVEELYKQIANEESDARVNEAPDKEKAMLSEIYNKLEIRIKHIGLNEEGGNALELAESFATFFNGKVRQTSKGYFGSELVEIMNSEKAKGRHGHIGLYCKDIDLAKKYYELLGYAFDDASATYDDEGKMKFIYFKDEIGGFAIHFVK